MLCHFFPKGTRRLQGNSSAVAGYRVAALRNQADTIDADGKLHGSRDKNSRRICFSEQHDNSLRNIRFAQRMFDSGQSDAFCEAPLRGRLPSS